MIRVTCACGRPHQLREVEINAPLACPACGRELMAVSAEQLADGAGEADFDARLLITGPDGAQRQAFLGGVLPISVGRLAGNHVQIESQSISRKHCTLHRVDFGPSRWRLVDENSRAGVFVGRARVLEHDLNDGDAIRLGEHELRFSNGPMAVAAATGATGDAEHPTAAGNVCPSCERNLKPAARICVACGIHVPGGRPLLLAQEVDENSLHEYGETFVQAASFIMPFTPAPIPLASEAYGGGKPWTIRIILALTTLVSLFYFFYSRSSPSMPGRELMLWPPARAEVDYVEVELTDENVETFWRDAKPAVRRELERIVREAPPDVPPAELRAYAVETLFEEFEARETGTFHWWQFVTSMLIHDPSGIFAFLGHFVFNMVFLFVFGSRVNALLGNVTTAILYPLLGAAASGAYLLMTPDPRPSLGASGAIDGLAGMYLVLFPVHRVFCTMWFRLTFRIVFFKIFALRGFWLLAIYLGMDLVKVLLGWEDGVAHWAHIGGFATGVAAALGVLASRRVNCRGGDLLSVILGRYAWPILGKPSRWHERRPAPTA